MSRKTKKYHIYYFFSDNINKELGVHTLMRLLILLLLPLLATSALAATLTGTVYTENLEPARYSMFVINTTPQQRILLVDGVYEVNVPPGIYKMQVAATIDERVHEDELIVEVKDQEHYIYDFILFPNEIEEDEELPSLEEDLLLPEVSRPSTNWIPAVILLIGLTVAVIFLAPRKWWGHQQQKETTGDLQQVLNAIKKEGGRTTQKELRKHIPVSEAKLSMMLTELEAEGKIKKIKKGRGNIIVKK